MLVAGLLVRLYGIFYVPAQSYDIGTYEAWGRIMSQLGPVEFFSSTWTDYLPLPIYFCTLIFQFSSVLSLNFGLLFKLIVTLLEIVLVYFIWQKSRPRQSLLLFALLFLSPVLLGDSAFWGQLDTIPSLLALLSLTLLLRQSSSLPPLFFPALLFGLSVALKPIMLLTLPVFALLLFRHYSLKKFLSFSLVSFLTFLLPALPVAGLSNAFSFLVAKALEQSSTYPYTTINAWNLWSIRPLNNLWPPDNYSVLGVSAHTLGLFLFLLFSIVLLRSIWRIRSPQPHHYFRLAGTLLVIFYVFATRMHERHLLFGLPFLAAAAITNRSLLLPLGALTASFTLNLWAAYSWVNQGQTWPVSSTLISLFSWVNVFAALFLVFVPNLKKFLATILQFISSHRPLTFIISLAILTRVVGLGTPPDYIFDEVYHSFTAREYLANNVEAWEWWTTPPPGVAYEWTHPPVAKYGMVLGMLLFGENAFGWRIGSAVAGVVSIIAIYYLVLHLFKRESPAVLTSFLLTFEGLHLVQSRIGMNDTYMLSLYLLTLLFALKKRWRLAAVLYGLALASKWSAIYGLIPLVLIYLWNYGTNLRLSLMSLLRLVLAPVRLVLISLLTYTLSFTPFFLAGHTIAQWWELHRQMWYYHTHLVATHAYQSVPWEWLFSLRPVWYFVEYGEQLTNIYAQGNPLILWLGLAALLMFLPKFRLYPYYLVFALYAVFVLPWVFSPRIMFFYHYLPSATFLTVFLALWLSSLPRSWRLVTLGLIVLIFVVLSPLYFGLAMPPLYWDTLFKLLPSWK